MPSSAQDNATLLETEFEAMLTRCEALGIDRKWARGHIASVLFFESVTASCEAGRARQVEEAASPKGRALQKAFELHPARKELCHLRKPADEGAYRLACEEYLRLAHGVGPGDTVVIHGWAKPRVIRLKSFHLSFSGECATDAFMWFEGEPVRNCPKRTTAEHGCPLDTPVYKDRA